MHKSKITMIVLGCLGIASTFLVWRTAVIPFFGMELNFKGIDNWPGYVAIGVMAIIIVLSIVGKKEENIQVGIPKMGILILGGLALLFGLFLEGAYAMNTIDTAGMGLHLFVLAAIGTVVVPFIFKADGSVHIPSGKEIVDDIEDSADIVEDKVEDFADKIEDKFEERFDKDDEEKEKEEKKADGAESSDESSGGAGNG